MNTALDLKTTDCSTAARGLQQCYQSHPPLPLGQHTIYGGNAETPIVRDAHLYVTLQEGSSCDLPAHRWDVKTSDLPLNPWKPGRQVIEAYFPIPDGHIPDDADQFKYLIHWVCTQLESKKKIHIGCIGGHGRTGMVMAAITAKFFGEMDAIQYVRNHYCSKAVESESQVHFLMEHYAVSSAETELNASWNTGKKSDYSSTFDSEHGFGCNDELALYREHVGPLSKRGKGFVAHCPLHTDIHPSLRIDTRKGKWLWYCDPCNQGGNIHQLLRRMGMQNLPYRSKSTLAEVRGPNPPVALGEPAATYPYLDASGKLAFEVLRFEYADVEGRRKKEFRQRRPDVNGGWHLNVPSDVRTIYNLPAVLAADTVLVCEGEKDCNTAAEHGFIATCNPMGAGKWEDRYSEFLRGKQVVIIPDVDEAGEKHSTRVFTSVRTCAQSVKIVRLPFGKDLTEWMEKGGTAGELKKLITTTAAEELTVPPVFQKPATFAKTDSGNAERFAAEHGNSVRHCHAIGKWYLWDGECWAKDDIGGVFRLAKQTVRQIYAEALELQDDEQRRALTRHALQSESAPRINAMLSLARSEPGIPVRLTDLDCESAAAQRTQRND